MKKNATMGANNGQMMMNNGSVIMKKGATMDTNVMASLVSKASRYISEAKAFGEKMLAKVAAIYSKELEIEVNTAQTWALIKAQMAFGTVLLTLNYLPLLIPSLIWCGVACLKAKECLGDKE